MHKYMLSENIKKISTSRTLDIPNKNVQVMKASCILLLEMTNILGHIHGEET